jgi:transcriptional regulator with XRE-family HTH domain
MRWKEPDFIGVPPQPRADNALAMPDALPQLDPVRLRNRLAELGLKQWWLAEQVGVDRRTVMRWVNGQVTRVQPAHLDALAAVLGVPPGELLQRDAAAALAGAEAQRAAGLALAGARLLERLGPVHEWDVAERLIKAVAVPDLPLSVLGRLYQQLCVACWRQDKLDEAAAHNQAALDIATRLDDRALTADALGSRANLRCWRGEVDAALADYRAALAIAPWLEPAQRGSLHSNLGAALYETGRLDEGEREIEAALDAFALQSTPMQRSIARAHLALIALERGDAPCAEREARRSQALARRADYRRGLALAPLLRADAAALRGDADAARALIDQGLAAFAALGIREALNQRLAARAWRRLGCIDEARAALAVGLPWAAGFPVERAALAAEAARLAMSPDVTSAAAAPPLP